MTKNNQRSKESYLVNNYTVIHKGLEPLCEVDVILAENNVGITQLYWNGRKLIYSYFSVPAQVKEALFSEERQQECNSAIGFRRFQRVKIFMTPLVWHVISPKMACVEDSTAVKPCTEAQNGFWTWNVEEFRQKMRQFGGNLSFAEFSKLWGRISR